MVDDIKIPNVHPRVQYICDGIVTAFSFVFPIFSDEDLEVFVGDARATLTEDYTVSGAGSSTGGIVTFASAPPRGTTVTIRRTIVIQRVTDFQPSSAFRASTINNELDYQTAALQDVSADVERCIKLSVIDEDAKLDLPIRNERKSKIIGFDEDGNIIAKELISSASHDALLNLEGDDHLHYHTDERALAWLRGQRQNGPTTDHLPQGVLHKYFPGFGGPGNAATTARSDHHHNGIYEPAFVKNSAFNKNFGMSAGEVAEGNHSHDLSYAPLFHAIDTANPHNVTRSQIGLGYVQNVKVNLSATYNPGVEDDSREGYSVGSRWANVVTNEEYVCLNAAEHNAVWKRTTSDIASREGTWGSIGGVLGDQTDLVAALEGKADTLHSHDGTYEPAFAKNTAFNKAFGTAVGQVAEGNHRHDGLYEPSGHEHSSTYAPIGHVSDYDNPHSVTKAQIGLEHVQNIKMNLTSITNPGITDDSTVGYQEGSRWINVGTQQDFVCVSASVSSAIWKETTDSSNVKSVHQRTGNILGANSDYDNTTQHNMSLVRPLLSQPLYARSFQSHTTPGPLSPDLSSAYGPILEIALDADATKVLLPVGYTHVPGYEASFVLRFIQGTGGPYSVVDWSSYVVEGADPLVTPLVGDYTDVPITTHDGITWLAGGRITAAQIALEPVAGVSSDAVQGAIEELLTSKADMHHTHTLSDLSAKHVSNADFCIFDAVDNSKYLVFNTTNISSFVSRSIVMPDQDINLLPDVGSFASSGHSHLSDDSNNDLRLFRVWSGSQANYDAISPKDENTLYFIET
jgi:hypothetical protein